MNKLRLHNSLSGKEKLRVKSSNINLNNESYIILELKKNGRLWIFIRSFVDILEDPLDNLFRELKAVLNI